LTDFHSSELTLVRNKRDKGNKKISKLCHENNWKSIPKEQVHFEVAPKDYCQTYSCNELSSTNKQYKSSIKNGSENVKGWKKPVNAINSISLKELEKLVEEMINTNDELLNSKNTIDATVEQLRNQIHENIAIMKSQENLHKKILQLDIMRYRRQSVWNVKHNQNHGSKVLPRQLLCHSNFLNRLQDLYRVINHCQKCMVI
jgi:hypothetical protein